MGFREKLGGRPPQGLKAERIWPALTTILFGVIGAYLVTSVVIDTSKRNVEILAALVFLGFVLVTHPYKALLFAVVVLFFPASTTVGTTSTLLIFAVGGLALMKTRLLHIQSPFVNRKIDLALAGFMVTMLLSLYMQDFSSFKAVFRPITGFVSGIVLYYLIIQLVDTKERFFKLAQLFEVMAVLMGILAVLQATFPGTHFLPEFFSFSNDAATLKQIRLGYVRARATFSGFELFAEFCAINLVLQYFMFRRARSINGKLFWVTGAAIMLMALFGTITRGGIIILLFGCAYAIVMSGLAIPRKELLRVAFVGMMLFYLILPFIGSYTGHMFERLSKLGTDDSSVHSREIVMQQALAAIPRSPFLGHGIYTPVGTFRGGVSQNIHSLYVSLAYKLGIPNLLLFLWFVSILVRTSWRQSQNRQAPRELREFMFGLHVVLIMFLLDEVKIEFLRSAQSTHIVFLYFGLIMSLNEIIKRSTRDTLPSSARRA